MSSCILQDLESECCEAQNEKRGDVDFDLKTYGYLFREHGGKKFEELKKKKKKFLPKIVFVRSRKNYCEIS